MKRLGRRYNRPLWSMKPTCGWSVQTMALNGTVAAISLLPPPKPCAASWWKTPAADAVSKEAVIANASTSMRYSRQSPGLTTTLLALDAALTKLAAKDAVKAELVKLRFYGGRTGKQAARLLGNFHGHRGSLLDVCRAWLQREISGEAEREK